MNKLLIFIGILSVFTISACKNETTYRPRTITGKPGETVVVISDEQWENEIGSVIRKTLSQPQLGLPQEEPLLDVIKVPHIAFKDLFKKNRNIITTNISAKINEPTISFTKDTWAYPQIVIKLSAKDEKELTTLFQENAEKILAILLRTEKKRLMDEYARHPDRGIDNVLRDKHDLSIKVQQGFYIAKDTTDFVWLRYETPKISEGIFLWFQDYTTEDLFTTEKIIEHHNKMLQQYVPGPTPGSYMQTEHRLDPLVNTIKLNGNYTTEIRGLWTVESDYMGGPFISLSILDPIRNRIVTAMGWVFAPKYDKRNFIREVEARIYSINFPDQEAMKEKKN